MGVVQVISEAAGLSPCGIGCSLGGAWVWKNFDETFFKVLWYVEN